MKLLLDANLALLMVVGLADRRFVGKHKRLQAYVVRDVGILTAFVSQFDDILFLPNVLTEVSNLAAFGVREPLSSRITFCLREVIARCSEQYVASRIAASRQEFNHLGLTDAAVLAALTEDTFLLTDDLELFAAAIGAGMAAETFQRLRQER